MQQADLFAAAPVAVPPELPTADSARPLVLNVLRQLQQAQAMPWRPTHLRAMEIAFPNMTSWLPSEERDRLRALFAAELARLQAEPLS